MPSLKSRLARAAARLIVSDPVAVGMLVAIMSPRTMDLTQVGGQIYGVLRSKSEPKEHVLTANPGVTPEAVRKAIEAYDGHLRKKMPAMMRDAERRFT